MNFINSCEWKWVSVEAEHQQHENTTLLAKYPRVLYVKTSNEMYIFGSQVYINNSLHLARKYVRIFVRGHYLFREAVSFEEQIMSKEQINNVRGTDNVQGQISEHIFKAKLRLLCLLSIGFKNWGISSDIRPRDAIRRLDQSRASEYIWWIIRADNLCPASR